MSEHKIKLSWQRSTPDFAYEKYDRTHKIETMGGTVVEASSAVEYLGKPEYMNPEEMLVAAISSCHMLSFLAVASKSRLTLDSYEDQAEGVLEKGPDGKIWITRVVLRPRITFQGEVTPEKISQMHDKAHHICFIANSVKTQVTVESR